MIIFTLISTSKSKFFCYFLVPKLLTNGVIHAMVTKKTILFLLIFGVLQAQFARGQEWRSALYPVHWQPGFKDSLNRFFHDFSYAGYQSGLKPIPSNKKNTINITKPPYNADCKGIEDCTKIIQKAIDDLGVKGGVIFFPAGEYKMSVEGDFGVKISNNNIVLKGAGMGKTRLKNTTENMRGKNLILFEPSFSDKNPSKGDWIKSAGSQSFINQDITEPIQLITVENSSVFKVGDLVVLYAECTDAFIEEHQSVGMWSKNMRGPRFCRFVTAIDFEKNTLTIDAPTRYALKKRDKARVVKIGAQLENCGIENLSIGNIQNHLESHWNDDEMYNQPNTGPYQVHSSHLIMFKHALNCWLKNVGTYRPSENKDDFHVLSNGVDIVESRFITLEKCNFQKSQYEGGGGNGYMYTLEGNDCLLKECYAEDGRHNYDFKGMSSNGNVIWKCKSVNPKYSSDFHMHLSMANLFDSFESDGDYIDARFRPWGNPGWLHSHGTTESVIWNSKGLKANMRPPYLVESRQWGWGYVVGTKGPESRVITQPVAGEQLKFKFDTSPEDFVEGVGKGETLVPQSLYLDMLQKRIERNKKK